MISIGKSYRFESAHFLPLVPDGHKCKNMHGHNYRVDIVIEGYLDTQGFVTDFADLDKKVAPLIAQLDHKLLNEVEGLQNPTAEHIAMWFFGRIACKQVKVFENSECWAQIGGEV